MGTTTIEHKTADGRVIDRAAVTGPNRSITPAVALVGSDGLPLGLSDMFGRLKTAHPTTLFDSKQIFDNLPLLWDDAETSGSGTSSTHSVNRASTTIAVAAATAGKRVRQTYQSFNYQPGKALEIMLTDVFTKTASGAGIVRRKGYFNDKNGVFWADDEGTLKVGVRSYATGAAVDTEIAQTSWNIDPMDGSGPSGVTLDPTKTVIYGIGVEWLGVGTVLFFVVIDEKFHPVHAQRHSNNETAVYMSSPNLPLRYEIENDGTGPAAGIEQICGTVIVYGGDQPLGVPRYASTAGTHVDADSIGTLYAGVGIRLKAGYIGAQVELVNGAMLAKTADDFEWVLLLNPTVAGTFTFSDQTNSAVQIAKGATANTVTGGTPLAGGFVKSGSSAGAAAFDLNSVIHLGASIAGTVDRIVLAVRPLTANLDIEVGLSWLERS